jgi:DNA polymerase-1
MTLDLFNARRHLLADEDLEDLYRLEIAQLPITLKMHRVGVKVHGQRAHETARDLDEKLAIAKAWLDKFAPELNWNSTKQVAELFDKKGIPYTRNAPTPKMIERGITIGNPSITKDDLERLAEEGYEFATRVVESRRFKHYADTFIRSYILENIVNGFVHGEFHPMKRESYGTVSGRYSSGGALNLQNIPARDPVWAPMVRGLYIPMSPDHDWWRFDYSQIEYRYLAHYAGGSLRRAYQKNPDVDFHQFVADIAGMPRKPAKNLNFAVVYGQGFAATMAQLGVSEDETRRFLDTYHKAVPEARRLMNRAMNLAAKRGYIVTWAGRRRRFQKTGRGQYKSLHKALNALLQGSAADLIKKAMVEVDKIIDWDEAVMHLTVHDELDFSLPKGSVGRKYAKIIKEAMESFDLTVPIKVDVEVGPDWGHCKEVDLAA